MAISTNPKTTIYRNLYDNTSHVCQGKPITFEYIAFIMYGLLLYWAGALV